MKEHLPELCERFDIETIGVFGEDTPESDVQYCFQKGWSGMFDLAGLHDYLVSVVHRRGGRVFVEYISPLIEQNVKADVVVFGAMLAIV